MKRLLKQFLLKVFRSVIFWSLAFCAFIFIRYFALNEEEGLVLDPKFDVPITTWLEFGVYMGIIIGISYAIIEWVFEQFISHKLNLGFTILMKTVLYLVLLVLSMSLLTVLIEESIDRDFPNEPGWWKTSRIFWLSVGYFVVCHLIFSFLKIAIERFGRGMFLKILFGKYRSPKEEKRIFMFLDLKSSTSMAETLGHYKYSQLIQDCFLDLNLIIRKYDAEIYQYVGDEAVLSWKYKNGVKDRKCINIYFDFINRLKRKETYYNEKYGVLPQFKAGIHGGTLMAAEVGFIKKEMAYHGDVINTTARIQGECNKYGEQLLISKLLNEDLNLNEDYNSKTLGFVTLKGKNQKVEICSVNLN